MGPEVTRFALLTAVHSSGALSTRYFNGTSQLALEELQYLLLHLFSVSNYLNLVYAYSADYVRRRKQVFFVYSCVNKIMISGQALLKHTLKIGSDLFIFNSNFKYKV